MEKYKKTSDSLLVIIDDSDIDAYLLQRLLKVMEYEGTIVRFADAQSALNYFGEEMILNGLLPDYIFLDLNMPDSNGFDFIETFKRELPVAITRHNKIILCTFSLRTEEAIVKAKAYGVKAFLEKPIGLDDLKSILKD